MALKPRNVKTIRFSFFMVRKTERVWLKLKRSWKTFLLCSMKVLLPIPSMSYRISASVSNLIILGSELDLNLSVPLLFSKVFLYRLWTMDGKNKWTNSSCAFCSWTNKNVEHILHIIQASINKIRMFSESFFELRDHPPMAYKFILGVWWFL